MSKMSITTRPQALRDLIYTRVWCRVRGEAEELDQNPNQSATNANPHQVPTTSMRLSLKLLRLLVGCIVTCTCFAALPDYIAPRHAKALSAWLEDHKQYRLAT